MARPPAATPTPSPARDTRAEEPSTSQQDASPPQSAPTRGVVLSRRWIVVLVVVWLVVNGAGLTYYQFRAQPTTPATNHEVDLGSYRFLAPSEHQHRLEAVSFDLHVALAPAMEKTARERLAARKYRVQQDIEELLRRAHPTDFDDPRLRELKRQLLEQVNESLGLQALSEVIITDLAMSWREGKPSAPDQGKSPPQGNSGASAKGEDAVPRMEQTRASEAHRVPPPPDGLATHH